MKYSRKKAQALLPVHSICDWGEKIRGGLVCIFYFNWKSLSNIRVSFAFLPYFSLCGRSCSLNHTFTCGTIYPCHVRMIEKEVFE